MKKIFLATVLLLSTLFSSEDYFYDYARVSYSKAVYENVKFYSEHRHNASCYEEYRVHKRKKNNFYRNENSIGLDTIVGLTAGVVIGNQIGKGKGRVAAKIIGGLIGANVANSMRNYKHVDSYDDGYYKRKRICNNKARRVHTKRVLSGYDNYFTYKGKEYIKFTKNSQNRIKVRNTISF